MKGEDCPCGPSVPLGPDVVVPPCGVHTEASDQPSGRSATVFATLVILSASLLLVGLAIADPPF